MTPAVIAVIGAMISAFAAWKASQEQTAESERNGELYKRLSEKSDEIVVLQKRLSKRSDAMVELQKELNSKTQKIADLNAKIAEMAMETTYNVTGGDSYCFVRILPLVPGRAEVSLTHSGKYPLSDIRIVITRQSDLNRINEQLSKKEISFEEYWNRHSNIGIHFSRSALAPDKDQPTGSAYIIGSVPFDPGKEETYQIAFNAKNGMWSELFRIYYDSNGEMKFSMKVSRFSKGRPVTLKE